MLAAGFSSVGLLGTRFTMDEPFYRARLEARGLTVVLPSPDDRAIVNRIIYEELVLGVVREESRAEYQRVMAALVGAGAEGVILGCTAIELLVEQLHATVPVFPRRGCTRRRRSTRRSADSRTYVGIADSRTTRRGFSSIWRRW